MVVKSTGIIGRLNYSKMTEMFIFGHERSLQSELQQGEAPARGALATGSSSNGTTRERRSNEGMLSERSSGGSSSEGKKASTKLHSEIVTVLVAVPSQLVMLQ